MIDKETNVLDLDLKTILNLINALNYSSNEEKMATNNLISSLKTLYNPQNKNLEHIYTALRCLIPENYGVYYEDNNPWRQGLWDKYYMQMPEQRRQFVERSVIVKRA
jgi:hypothetical protein